MLRNGVILLLLSICATSSYKFLVYSPIFGYSHMNFMGAIADTLTEAGHDVTVLMPIMDEEQVNKTGVKLTKNIIKTPPDPRTMELQKDKADVVSKMWTLKPTLLGLLQMGRNMTEMFTFQCEALISDEQLMKRLENEKFDVGISEVFTICGLGIFETLHIPATIATFSGVHLDLVSKYIGEPVVPSMSGTSDRMGFTGRLMNVVDSFGGEMFFGQIFSSEIEAFRAKLGPQFKSYEELLAQASYMFTNSNPYLDYPRPMLHKTVPLGGITVPRDKKKNVLPKEWDSILNARKRTAFVSFGSVAQSIYMPELYKKTLLSVFESMPDTTFIWKYEEKGAKLADHLKNVHLSTWVPQNALLADPRLTVFVTHGGLGSTTELAHLGKPAILIPIFADQPRNAQMLAKHGTGIVLTKYDLENPQKLKESLERIFSDESFSQNATRLSEMLLSPPISAKQLLIRHSEFAAKFGRLPNLDPYGRQLSFVEYFLLDVFLAAIVVIFVAVVVTVMIFRKCLSLFSTKKKKMD
ncbi:unnamed protein product [Nippostrongylus brasiliensis]|uniref:UDP-glucuronosyltransferase n=1 Tax=Nippostrongylus brasiliensis TaxID=27835 RepID=A0A0N4Y8H5_NIPBR|nr:unnamed protein product [Nippostrongylus brasiliensis]